MKHVVLFFVLLSIVNFNCRQSNPSENIDNKNIVNVKSSPSDIEQLVIATNKNYEDQTGELFGVEWNDGKWDTTFTTIPCSFGKNGIAEINQKLEGDGKTPSGVFELGMAFGYQKDIEAEVEFLELKDNHYWVSDTASQQYNQLVYEFPKGIYAEKMRRNDHLYKYGVVVEYNTQPVIKNKGSAIFIHIERRKGAPTAGCIAMSEEKMKAFIEWLQPNLKPTILIENYKNIDFQNFQMKK